MGIEVGMVDLTFAGIVAARLSDRDRSNDQRHRSNGKASQIAVSGECVAQESIAQRFGCFGARS